MTLQGYLQRQATDQAAILDTLRVRVRLINLAVSYTLPILESVGALSKKFKGPIQPGFITFI